jgi:N6-adenosine-specific RNA methylase IME4
MKQNKDLIKLEQTDWWKLLVDDCQSILVEGIWNYRLTLIKTYHLLGKRILKENDNFERVEIYGKKIVSQVSQSLGQSERTIWRVMQFVNKYPDLDLLPEGKNISWHKICNNLLPVLKEKEVPLPEGKYNVILADPPWTYKNTGVEGAVDKEYPTMTIEELCEMPIKERIVENAVLFLWTTNPILEECFPIIKSWGFEYKTNFCWIKTNKKTGIGFYVRGVHELLLICIKGQMLPEFTPLSVIKADTKEHSRKPEIYDLIEEMYPNGKYLELFARNNKKREGWSFWGREANT